MVGVRFIEAVLRYGMMIIRSGNYVSDGEIEGCCTLGILSGTSYLNSSWEVHNVTIDRSLPADSSSPPSPYLPPDRFTSILLPTVGFNRSVFIFEK